jgi:inositol polyphosphate 5-phosphatase INPP5B/F
VVRVERAKDVYLAISAEFERSCYGVSLDELIFTTEPMRYTSFPALISPTSDAASQPPASPSSNSAALKQAVPKELWRLIDALWTGGALREKDLFGQTPDKDELAAVREALDCGLEFPVCSPHALAEALVSFLEALAKPVVPMDLLPASPVEQQNLSFWSRKFFESLPALSYNVMIYTLSFMREVLAQAEYNRSTSGRLANVCLRCFAPTIDALPNNNQMLSKEDRIRRDQRLGMFLDVIVFLLTTTTI